MQRMIVDSREKTRQAYSGDGRAYDRYRLEDPRGRLLSKHDIRLFEKMIPRLDAEAEIVEIGAGTGRFTLSMLDKGYRVIATDINQGMLGQLQSKIESGGYTDRCQTQIENIFELSFPDAAFNFAYTLHVIPRFSNLSDQRSALLEVARTIKPGGKLLFNYRNSKSLIYGPFYKGHGASPKQIDEILREAGMSIVLERGKWIITRALLNKAPLFLGKVVACIDRTLLKVWPRRAWDVFVLAVKDGPIDASQPEVRE